MANHKSALKRNRQNAKRNERNKTRRTRIKNAIKGVLIAVDENNKDDAQNELKMASKTISECASKGAIHKRTASRKIAGLAKKVHQVSASA
ncbi:30S ribosomal protein S20 [Candidatus Nitromaritima sp. SCGC AAA799-A02]|nr:30S ribosomal protein S20 [Candidatus Nitromaritima sp. SCGC AAA799-A02]